MMPSVFSSSNYLHSYTHLFSFKISYSLTFPHYPQIHITFIHIFTNNIVQLIHKLKRLIHIL